MGYVSIYDRCNQDDYATKSDRKRLTGLPVSLLKYLFGRIILLPVSSSCKRW